MEYMIVPKSTRIDPTAISNPKPFSKYNTEITRDVNLRRFRIKLSVRADDSDVSRCTPEMHMNLSISKKKGVRTCPHLLLPNFDKVISGARVRRDG